SSKRAMSLPVRGSLLHRRGGARRHGIAYEWTSPRDRSKTRSQPEARHWARAGGRMYGLLIAFHIAAGTTALVAAAAALATSKGDRWHVYAGRAFTLGMLVVFLTAVPMTLIRPNLFLLLIAVFS